MNDKIPILPRLNTCLEGFDGDFKVCGWVDLLNENLFIIIRIIHYNYHNE